MRKLILLLIILLSFFSLHSQAQTTPTPAGPNLGKAAAFTVLAGAGVENTGLSRVDGDLGISPGTVYTGGSTVTVNGTTHINDAAAAEAQADLNLAYQQAQAMTPTQDLTGQNMARKILTPGVYKFLGPLTLSDSLFLDNRANVGGAFVFQVNGDLNLTDLAKVRFLKTATSRTQDVFWQVSGNITLANDSRIIGSVMGDQQITVGNTRVRGRLLSRNGTITMSSSTITFPTDIAVVVSKPDIKYKVGDQIPITVTARNNGPMTAPAEVTITISKGFSFWPPFTVSAGSYDASTNKWTLNFPNGAQETLEFLVRVNSDAASIGESVRASINFSSGALMVDEVEGNNTYNLDPCIAPTTPGSISGPAQTCVGMEATYTISPVGGASGYIWDKPADWVLKSGSESTTNTITYIVGQLGGTVSVQAQNSCGSGDASALAITTSATPPPSPGPIQTAPENIDACLSQQTATYSIEAVETATSYLWEVPDGWTIHPGGQGTTSITVTLGTTSGDVKVTAINGCLPSNASRVLPVTVSVADPEPIGEITGTTACVGYETSFTVSGAAGATSFTWTLPEGWSFKDGTDSTASSIVVIVGAAAGEITVTGVNGCGLTSTASYAVNPITVATPAAIVGPSKLCLNTDYTYRVDPVPGATSYLWNLPAGLTFADPLAANNTNVINVKVGNTAVTGSITVKALYPCDVSGAQSLSVTTGAKPGQPQAITKSLPNPCAGQTNLVYSIPPVNGATFYTWTLPDGWAFVGASNGTSITVTAGSTAGVIEVKAENECGAGLGRTTTVTPSTSVPMGTLQITGTNNPCLGNTNLSYAVNALSDVTQYTWEVPTGWTIVSGQGTTNIVVNVGSGSGQVKVSAVNNCGTGVSAAQAVTVSTTPSPAPGPIIYSTAVPCVRQENITYSVPPLSTAFSYKWEITGDWVITGGQGTTAVTVTAGTGPATITVKAINGCGESGSSSLAVTPTSTVPPVPLAINGTTIACENQTNLIYSVAAVTEATSYTWEVPAGWQIVSGQGTASITVQAGTTGGNITVKAGNNCGNSEAKVMAVQTATTPPANPGPISGSANLCAGQSGLTFSVAAVTGAASYTWSVPSGWTITSGQGSTSIAVTVGSTSGKIRVKAVNGCGSSTESELAVAPSAGLPLMPAAIIAGAEKMCAGDNNLVYAISPMLGVSTYNWQVPSGWTITGGQGTPSITVTAGSTAGDISVTAFNNCGASPARTYAVTPSVIPATPAAISGQVIPCVGSTGNTYSVSAVTGATSYEWALPAGWVIASGQGSTSITVEAGAGSGEISVKAVNDCGKSVAALLAVKPTTAVPAVPGTIAGSKSICETNLEQTYSYAVAAESNASSYVWTVPAGWVITSGQGTLNITVLASATAGTISVVAENGCGQSVASSLPVSIDSQAPPTPGVITGNTTVCAETSDITYTVESVSGAASYTWSVPEDWTITSGQGTTSIKVTTGTTAGQVTVTATNGCGSSTASTQAVALNAIPATPPTISGQSIPCASSTGNTYSIEAVAGATSYAWVVPGGWVITSGQGSTSISVEAGTEAGEISVKAVNDCGQSVAAVLAVKPTTAVPAVPGTIAGSNSVCDTDLEQTYSYTVASEINASNYLWTVPDGWTITSGQGTLNITVKASANPGTISVIAENGCGQSLASSLSVSVTNLAPPTPGQITGNAQDCANKEEVTYSVSMVNGATTYAWSVPEDWTITSGQGTTSIKVTTGTTAGQVSVVASNGCGSSTASTLAVALNAIPATPPTISGQSIPCAGSTGNTYSIEAVAGATSYAWVVPAGWVITSGQGSTSISVEAGTEAGQISVQAGNECGQSVAAVVAVKPATTVPAIPGTITGSSNVCETDVDQTYSYSVASETNASNYVWTVPNGWTITSGQGTLSITVKASTSPGTISVVAENGCGQSLVSSLPVSVTRLAPPTPGVITGNATVCAETNDVTYTVKMVNGATTYAWSVPEDWTITSGQGTTSVKVKTGTTAGQVSVVASNGCGSSTASTLAVALNAIPATPPTISGQSIPCAGSTGNTYSVEAVAGATSYAWVVPGGWVITSGQGSTSITVQTGTEAGEISVQAGNECGQSVAAVLAVKPATAVPAVPGTIAGSNSVCDTDQEQKYSYSVASEINASSYLWTLPDGWEITSGQGTLNITVKASANPGTISVIAENGCGQSLVSSLPVSVTNLAPPTPGQITGNAQDCANKEEVTYSVSMVNGATTYAWTVPEDWTITSGQGTTSVKVKTGTTAGQVSVVASNGCGSSTASTLAVALNAIPATPPTISGQPIPCAGSTGNTYSIEAVAGATSYAWVVPGGWVITSGQGSTSISVQAGTGAGEISVQVGNECGQSVAAVLAVKAATAVPAVPGTIAGSNSVCVSNLDLNYSYTVPAESSASNYIWSVPPGWEITSGQGTLNVTVKAGISPGTISVMAQNGCGVSQVSFLPVSVTNLAPPAPGLITGSTQVCAGQEELSYSIGSVSGAITYTWAVPADWTILSGQGTTSVQVKAGQTAGQVSVTATNGCGSSTASTLDVALNTLPGVPLAIAGQAHQCAGNTGSIYSVEPVAGAVSYTWTVPADWTITAGQGSPAIIVTAGQASGEVTVKANNDCSSSQGQVLVVTSSTTPSPAPGRITPAYSGLICSQQDGLTYTIDPITTATSYTWSVPEGWTITAGQGATSITVTAGANPGDISVKAINGCGESLSSSLAVVPTQAAAVSIGAITGEQQICSGRAGLVYAVAAVDGATTYTWTVPADWTITGGQGTNQITVTAGNTGGAVTVTAANTCITSLPSTFDTRVNASPVAPVAIEDISSPCSGLSYTLQSGGEGQSYTWTLPLGWTITEGEGTATIKVTAPEGSQKGLISVVANSATCSSAPVSVEADPNRAQVETKIANVFSPNGDGVNDNWQIVNIENYPDNDLVIINRWGNEVYRSKSYRNQWNGGELSAGTYYYVLKMKVCDGSYKTYKGYVMIMR